MRRNKKVEAVASRFTRAALAGVLALGLAPLPAFAADLTAGSLDTQADALSPDGYVIAAAFAAAEPAPELLGLNNPNFRNTGEADNIYPMFGDSEVNENPDPYVSNYKNGLTPGIIVGGRAGGPMAALTPYDTENAEAAQNLLWNMAPHIILGTGADAIPENEHDFYNTDAYARAAEIANGWEANSYNPIGVTYNRVSLPTMIQTMYRLAEAANEVVASDDTLKTRYEDPVEIAKDYERYIVGQKGAVLQAINAGKVRLKTIALVESYDSSAGTYTIITDGVAEGTATTNRYLEAVQGVSKNYYDEVGEAGATVVTKDQLKNDVDTIIVGGNAGSGTESLSVHLAEDGLIGKTFYCVNWANGSVFGTTVNSVENAQNVGRILPCVYPEVLDQSDMVSYYYDTFYHIKDGKIASMIAERMDGVRNWANTDSASLTAWEETDYAGYDQASVEALITSGVAYLNSQDGLSDYLTPSSYLASDTAISEPVVTNSKAVISVDSTSVSKRFGDEPFSLQASVSKAYDGTLSYASDNDAVAAVDEAGEVTVKGVGTATITISGTEATYYAAPDAVQVAITVAKKGALQTITASDVTKTVGDAAFALGAKTSGGGALSYATSSADVATVAADGTVTIKGAGTATITVTAAETDTYAKATKAVKVTVKKKTQAITASNVTKTFGAAAFALGAKTSGNGKLTYASSNAKVATVAADGKVTIKGAGTATITVTAAETSTYTKATKSVKITVNKKAQTITAANKAVAMGKTVSIGAKASGKGTITYKSSNAKIAKVSAKGVVTPVKVGTAKITVTAAATANYAKATKTITVTVKQGAQSVAFSNQTKAVSLAKVKKAKQVVAISKATKAKTTVTYAIAKVSKSKANFSIDKKTGKITVKKGTAKGTYKVTVKATAQKTANYKAAAKSAVITINVK